MNRRHIKRNKKEVKKMLFATVIEPPQQLKIGSIITQENKPFEVTKITNVEFVNNTALIVSGVGKFVK